MSCWGTRLMQRIRWAFNGWMLWGAFCGWMIIGGWSMIQNAMSHDGPGYVWYEQPDRVERVSEATYKRHEKGMGGMLIFNGFSTGVHRLAQCIPQRIDRCAR